MDRAGDRAGARDLPTLSATWRDAWLALILFLGALAFFVGFGRFQGWPNAAAGWSLLMPIAIGIAATPLLLRLLTLVIANRGSLEAFGVKIGFNFEAALKSSEATYAALPPGVVQQGVIVLETGNRELEETAQKARSHQVLVVDVEDGRAWYLTRLFALAATAEVLGSPSLLVLLGQEDGKPHQAAGTIAPADLVRTVTQKDTRYLYALRNAQAYLRMLRSQSPAPLAAAPGAGPRPPPTFRRLAQYQFLYPDVGDAIFMRVLIEELAQPDVNVLGAGEPAPEAAAAPPWVTLPELRALLGPWLHAEFIDMAAPPKAQISAILGAKGDCVLAVRDGTFEGLIEVDRAVRHVLRQLVERSPG